MRIFLASVALILLVLGAATAWSGLGADGRGVGLYGEHWQPDPMHEYWDPGRYHEPEKESMTGRYTGDECVACHAGVTPGIVKDWQISRHANPGAGQEPVACDGCHGNDHQRLDFPTPATCGRCHGAQHEALLDERRFGFPSHALAMERAVDAQHFADKPKQEVLACLQCHSVATKCDSCHTRHRFNAAEARRPEACITCHSGPPHPDDETFFDSAHGRIYLNEGAGWDWSRPLRNGEYKAPSCAYCHMRNGRHQVAENSIWKFGIREVNPQTAENRIKRKRWVHLCLDCHESKQAETFFEGLDQERKRSWKKLYRAEAILRALRSEGKIYPNAVERPRRSFDWLDRLWPRPRIGFYEGQASAFYNVSPIERSYFEMWYFDNLRAYKGAAHGADGHVKAGHAGMDRALVAIERRAEALRRMSGSERPDPRPVWMHGEYTDFNRLEN